jgi:hypothetical protein
MVSEQTLMNAAVLIVSAQAGHALAGFVFNILLIVRAPLQLFQAIQTSILPTSPGSPHGGRPTSSRARCARRSSRSPGSRGRSRWGCWPSGPR